MEGNGGLEFLPEVRMVYGDHEGAIFDDDS